MAMQMVQVDRQGLSAVCVNRVPQWRPTRLELDQEELEGTKVVGRNHVLLRIAKLVQGDRLTDVTSCLNCDSQGQPETGRGHPEIHWYRVGDHPKE